MKFIKKRYMSLHLIKFFQLTFPVGFVLASPMVSISNVEMAYCSGLAVVKRLIPLL